MRAEASSTASSVDACFARLLLTDGGVFLRSTHNYDQKNTAAILIPGFQRVDNPLVRSRAESPCGVWGNAPHRQNALQGVNFKTVRWTVLKEGTLCTRERPLVSLASRTALRNYSARTDWRSSDCSGGGLLCLSISKSRTAAKRGFAALLCS